MKEFRYRRSNCGFRAKTAEFIAVDGSRYGSLLSLIVALALSVFIAAPAFAALNLGNTSVGILLDGGDSNYLNGSKVNVGSTGVTLTSMSAFVGGIDTSPYNQYQMAVYTDNAGTPGSLVSRSGTGTLIPNAWNSLPISAALQPNKAYWLIYNTNGRTDSANNMYYNTGSNGQGLYSNSSVNFGTWPTNFPVASLTTAVYSLYATADSASDPIPPSVSITAPASGAFVSGTTTVSATATDNASVPRVQFKVDTTNLGGPITAPPYNFSWNTALNSNGNYTLTAIATDAAGNQTTSAPVTVTIANTDLRSQTGEWSPVKDWPLIAIHAILLKSGNILVWDHEQGIYGSVHPKVWDPATDAFTDTPVVDNELFCAGHVNLADGRVFTAGGHRAGYGEDGIEATYLYDADANIWTRTGDMAYDRWYPTLTKLGDGRVVIASGMITTGVYADIPEIYNPGTGLPATIPSINTSQLQEEEYPADFHLPNGKILAISPEHGPVQLLDAGANTWTNVNTTPVLLGSAVQYRPGKILMSGGARAFQNPSVKLTAVLDMNAPMPAWRTTAPMSFGRYMHNMVMLPTGKVLAIGGSTSASQQSGSGTLPSEIWDPDSEAWITVASLDTPRVYHSTALLLPDGRVLAAGGGHNNPLPNQFSAQVYSPPYLFKGPQPTITGAPDSVPYGTATFTVDSPDAADIASVTLIALGSVTHSIDMNQFYTELPFTAASGQLSVTAPQNGNQVPPGHYMLFIMDSTGIPSVARIIKIGSASAPPAPTLQSIAVTPANPTILTGAQQEFTATGTYSDGSTQNLTSQVTWASSNTAVATVNASGLATGISAGTSTISSALDGKTGNTLLTVQGAPLTITTASLPGGTVGMAYSATPRASGGAPPYTWLITSGSLPNGLALAGGTGAITGTPTATGTSSFTIQVSDSSSGIASRNLSIMVTAAQTSRIGLSTIGSLLDSGDSDYLNGSKVTTTNGGSIVSMSAYVGSIDSASGNRNFQLSIYTNSGVMPGTLVASSTTGTLVANSWNTLPISATLQPDASYWLIYSTNGRTASVNNMYYNTGSNGQGVYSNSSVNFGTWPTNFPVASLTTAVYSLYATFGP